MYGGDAAGRIQNVRKVPPPPSPLFSLKVFKDRWLREDFTVPPRCRYLQQAEGEEQPLPCFYCIGRVKRFLGWEDGFGFDLNSPFGVEESSHDHGGGGADGAKDLAMSAADLFPIFCAGEEHAGSDDVVKWISGGAGLGEGFFDEGEDRAGLLGG